MNCLKIYIHMHACSYIIKNGELHSPFNNDYFAFRIALRFALCAFLHSGQRVGSCSKPFSA